MKDLAFWPLTRLSAALESGEVDAEALTQVFLERALGMGRALNCYLGLCLDTARVEARAAAERARAKRRRGELDGIPVALKDNIDIAGVPTSNGLGGLPYRVPTDDAEVVRRLRAAGAVLLGKLNMHEAALGATNDNPHFGRAYNPFRASHSPGGSSGGSGAAVAAGLCAAAIGTATGGSVRIPASYCGVVGMKPSFGLLSTRGVVPLSHRFDHVGVLARSVADAGIMVSAMAGFDPLCPQSRPGADLGSEPPCAGRLDGVRLAVIDNFAGEASEPDVTSAFHRALELLRRLGAEVVRVRLPSYDAAQVRRAAFIRVEADAAVAHAALYAKEPERFSATIGGYLEWGARLPASRLSAADRVLETAASEITRCLEHVDAIVSPSTPQAAPAFDDKPPDNAGAFCVAANITGCPAVSVPMGSNALRLPLGLQVMTAVHRDARALEIAACYEAAAGAALRPSPPIGPSD